MSSFRTAQLEDLQAEQWPYWAPIRHHFGITSFGVNAWRGNAGDRVITPHDESESGAAELYVVMSGAASFTIGGEEVDAPSGTLLYVEDPAAERVAFAKTDGTVVLSIGAAGAGKAYAPSGWDTRYLEGGE